MNRLITQIYEIQTPVEAEMVIQAGVDHIGSVVVSANDWKKPLIKETIGLVSQAHRQSSLILLYNEPDLVFKSLEYYQPDIVHFCEILVKSQMTKEHQKVWQVLIHLQDQIRTKFPAIKIMRTIPIPDNNALSDLPFLKIARAFEPVSDYFLTDTLIMSKKGNNEQPVSGFVGITGKTCSWDAAAELVAASNIPVILAGGLSPDNVYEGIMAVLPAGVDSCTLTNACDESGSPIRFKKDLSKVKRFVKEAIRASESD